MSLGRDRGSRAGGHVAMAWRRAPPTAARGLCNFFTGTLLCRIKGLVLMGRSFAVVLVLLSALVIADGAAAVEGAGEAGILAALRGNGAQLLPLGERSGLAGYLVTRTNGEVYTLYITPDGHGIVGLLYAPDGGLVTGAQVATATAALKGQIALPAAAAGAFVPTPRTSGGGKAAAPPSRPPVIAGSMGAGRDLAALLRDSGQGFGFTLAKAGSSARSVVVFGDPACPWSRSAVARLGEQALAGRLRLRVLPVALLGEASARWAAGVASASDPALAWFAKTPGAASADGARHIERNNALFSAWGERSVPLILWRDRDGRISRRAGDIGDVEAWLAEFGP